MQNLLNLYNETGRDLGETLNLLKEVHKIKVKEYADEGLYVLNYDQIESPKTDPIVMECRGTIVDKDFQFVCIPFRRFFNYGEALNVTEKFDFRHAYIMEKVDGSLVKVYYWNGSWRIATRGTAFAESENYTGQKFVNMILDAFGVSGFDEFNEKFCLNNAYTYLFEFVSPQNRVVTPYKKAEMVFLGCTVTEVNSPQLIDTLSSLLKKCGLNVRSPKMYNFNSIEDMKAAVSELEDLAEGYVCCDDLNQVRIKLKSPKYVAVHRIRGESIPTPKRIANLVVTNEVDEYLTYFEDDRSLFEPYMNAYISLETDMCYVYNSTKNIESQKEFALKVKDCCYSAVMFMARSRNEDPLHVFRQMTPEQKIKILFNYMSNKEQWTTDKEKLHLASEGKLCPRCESTGDLIVCVGAVPDGINMNYAYDCKNCGEQWEGY